MKVLCTICARGGSQGVKNKNLSLLCRKPLIAHSILQAKHSKLFDAVAVSSDSQKILQVAKQYGADHLIVRPIEMATSAAAKLPAIQHAVFETESMSLTRFDVVVDLDATAPLRTVEDLQRSLNFFLKSSYADNLITGCLARKSPYFNLVELDGAGFARLSKKTNAPFVRRQDVPLCYDMNASIYIWKRDILFQNSAIISDRTLLYVMPEERSIDIDTALDLKMVRWLAKQRRDLYW